MISPTVFNRGFRNTDRRALGVFLKALHKPDNFTLGSQIFDGSGVPPVSLGQNGALYIRRDTPGTANQRLYMKSSGVWISVL